MPSIARARHRSRSGSAAGARRRRSRSLERHDRPLPEDRQGIAISTFGKVIKRGWDWLGLTPAAPARVSGLDRGAGPRGVPHAQQERLHPHRPARRRVPRVSQGDPGSGLATARRVGRCARRGGAAAHACGWSAISSACSKISPTTFRCCARSSIGAPAGRSGCRCRAAATNACPGRCSRTSAAEATSGHAVAAASRLRASRSRVKPRRRTEELPTGALRAPESERDPARHVRHLTRWAAAPANRRRSVGTLDTVPGRRRPARYGLLVQFESRPDDPGARPAGRQHDLDQRRASRVHARGGVALDRLPHRAGRGARAGAAGGRRERRARVHHAVPGALGRGEWGETGESTRTAKKNRVRQR